MKAIRILCITLAACLTLNSCHKAIWDKLDELEERIAKLERFCNQLNTNINSLQALVNTINERDYVKNLSSVVNEDGEVIGYTISFNKHESITIFNGKHGEDAPIPQVGIRKDFDDIWYWTLNGDWLLDEDGNKVRADGSGNGRDGITPQLKIEAEYWWISYDKGATWTQMGKATGERGADGDSMFSEVRQDEHFVYLVLADGEEIQLTKGGLYWVYV